MSKNLKKKKKKKKKSTLKANEQKQAKTVENA